MRGQPALPPDFRSFPYVNPDAPKGGELRVAEIGTFDSLVPWLIKGTAPQQLDWAYDRLMARSWDEPFTLYPLIAESVELKTFPSPCRERADLLSEPQSGEVSKSGEGGVTNLEISPHPPLSGHPLPTGRGECRTLTVHLDPRARFQDGVPITSADIQFSWEFLMKNGRPNTRRMFKNVLRVEIQNDRTLTFFLRPNSDPETPMILAMMTVLPKHYWAPMGDGARQTTLVPPVGSGPYKISQVEAGRTLVLTRDDNYWAKDLPSRRGLFNFDRVRVDFYRDEGVALQAFRSGAYDFRRETNPKRWTSDYNIKGMAKRDAPDGKPAPLRALVFNTRRPLFQDIRVREALQLAFDFEWLNKNVFRHAYVRTESIFPKSALADGTFHAPQTDGSGPSGQRDNLRRAQDLLAAAGWQSHHGLMQNAAGDIFEFEILLNDPADEKIALHYARSLARLGIAVRLRTIDSAQFTGRLEQFDFDMATAQWVSTLSPGSEQAVYWSSAAAHQNGSRNYPGIADESVDAAIAALNHAKTNDTLVQSARMLDRTIMSGRYFIPLYHAPADWVAYWPKRIMPPTATALYGTTLEAWWAKP